MNLPKDNVRGGLLTQAFSWQAIFVVQVPFAVLAVPAALTIASAPALVQDRHRPAVRPNLTLALLSAALTAALLPEFDTRTTGIRCLTDWNTLAAIANSGMRLLPNHASLAADTSRFPPLCRKSVA